MSVPTSEMMVWAMDAEMPVTATRSTPVMHARCARASSRGWCFDVEPGLTRGYGASGSRRSTGGFITANGRAIGASQAARGCVYQSKYARACWSMHHGSARHVPVRALASASSEDLQVEWRHGVSFNASRSPRRMAWPITPVRSVRTPLHGMFIS
jgi:hypothetical protein